MGSNLLKEFYLISERSRVLGKIGKLFLPPVIEEYQLTTIAFSNKASATIEASVMPKVFDTFPFERRISYQIDNSNTER